MAAHESTIINAPGHTTGYAKVKWSSFDSGPNNVYFDVSNVDASKLIILVAGNSTLEQNLWIGTSDSRSSGGAPLGGFKYPYSAGNMGPMKIKSTATTRADPAAAIMDTIVADTEVWDIRVFGPFETARFKDSDGYINVCRGKVTTGGASHSSDEHKIAGILIP